MEIQIEEENNYVTMKLNGSLIENSNSEEFNHIIIQFLNKNKKNIIVDLENVTYINSTGLSILFRGYRAIDKVGGRFKLVNLNKKTKNLLSITKLDTLFDIQENIGSAVESFTR